MSISFTSPWLATPQAHWENQANYPDTPDWYRLWCLAAARAEPNLHAEFGKGQLAMLMGKEESGKFAPMGPSRLSNVIKQAVGRRLLDESSGVNDG